MSDFLLLFYADGGHMSGAIGKYLLSVAASAMLLSLVQSILPKGHVQQVVGFVGGILVILAVLSPVMDVGYDSLTQTIIQFQKEAEEIEATAIIDDRQLISDIIKEKCRTYIWDKANELGADLEVEVILSEDGDYPYPVSVILTGRASSGQRIRIEEYISQDLGIPAQRQEWNVH